MDTASSVSSAIISSPRIRPRAVMRGEFGERTRQPTAAAIGDRDDPNAWQRRKAARMELADSEPDNADPQFGQVRHEPCPQVDPSREP